MTLPNRCSRQNNNKKARELAEKTSQPYLCGGARVAAGSPAHRAPRCQLSTGVFVPYTHEERLGVQRGSLVGWLPPGVPATAPSSLC